MAKWAKHVSVAGGYVNLDIAASIDVFSINGTDWYLTAGGKQLTGDWPSNADALAAAGRLATIEDGLIDPSTV